MGGKPDEGTFDWLDDFMAEKPNYFELSDRKIIEWAQKSGIQRPQSSITQAEKGGRSSNDKPDFCFGIPSLDDCSVRTVIANMTNVVPRNYVVMEVKANLIQAERAENLKRFPSSKFKRSAYVVMGEPNKEFKDKQLDIILKDRQEKAVVEWKAKKAEKERKRAQEKRMKQVMKLKEEAN